MRKIIDYLDYILLAINCLFLLKGFFKAKKSFKVFSVYCFAMFIIQMNVLYLAKQHKNNLYLSHYYFIIQFIILSYFYYLILKEDFQKKIVVIASSIGLIIIGIQYYLHPEYYYEFNLLEIFIASFLIVIYAVFHLYNQLSIEKEYQYINIGILVYLFGSTVFFLAGNLMIKLNKTINELTWNFNSILYIVYQCFILFELYKMNYKKNKISI